MREVRVAVMPNRHWWQSPRYRLLESVTVAGHTVPAGFVTDGATVPRLIAVVAGLLAVLFVALGYYWSAAGALVIAVGVIYFPPVGKYLQAAIVHDWLLEGCPGGGVVRAGLVRDMANKGPYQHRRLIDREFLRVMELLLIAVWRRLIMYRAVRLNSVWVWVRGWWAR